MRWFASREPEPVITLEEVVRFAVASDVAISRGKIIDPPRSRNETDAQRTDTLVTTTLKALRGATAEQLAVFKGRIEEHVKFQNLQVSLISELNGDRLEAKRSRAMVKYVKAELDRSDNFYTLLETSDENEIAYLDDLVSTNSKVAVR